MKRLTEEEYNILKRFGFAAIRSNTFVVGKEYTIYPPKNYVCNGVKPLNGVTIRVRCSQNMPHVLTTDL